jgi:hypothetical protein
MCRYALRLQLKEVIEIINAINFDKNVDIFHHHQFLRDLLLKMGTESGTGGEFHTPRPVIKFMVEVIDPQIGETIYDPAFGSAGFLLALTCTWNQGATGGRFRLFTGKKPLRSGEKGYCHPTGHHEFSTTWRVRA